MELNEKKTKPKSREYPAVTLSNAIAFIEKMKDFPQNKPISYELAASACGVKISTNSFKYTLSAAKQYGLIATATGKTLTLLDPAKEFARPTKSPEEHQLLKIECFKTPKLYKELIQEYNGCSLPEPQKLANILINQFSILPAVANVAASNFIVNATEIGVVQNNVLDLSIVETDAESTTINDSNHIANRGETNINTTSFSVDDSFSGPEYAAPLYIPFGDKRRAVLYMPIDSTKEDAEYVKDMINLMFKRVYKVE